MNMKEDLLCFCHLRWNFVYQRPQHLLSRFAKHRRVFIMEEPILDAVSSYNDIVYDETAKVWVITPHLSAELTPDKIVNAQKRLLDMFMDSMNVRHYILWYYSPMALQFSQHLDPVITVYDCMDELSSFEFAPAAIKQMEAILFKKADVVFTGGHHLYEFKRSCHHNIYPFPSSIDKHHFETARTGLFAPQDQVNIPTPRIGFYGVVDERFDIQLLQQVADLRPEWHFVIIGPVVKIDPALLPQNSNIHYLGGKSYKELPQYLAGWDIAMLPFALNASTTYISPTKTPEYLAGGKPVISTAIRDVVKPYGEGGHVHIIHSPEKFVTAAETILHQHAGEKQIWLKKVDALLENNSWDNTWNEMNACIETALSKKHFKIGFDEVVAKSA